MPASWWVRKSRKYIYPYLSTSNHLLYYPPLPYPTLPYAYTYSVSACCCGGNDFIILILLDYAQFRSDKELGSKYWRSTGMYQLM
jgi:hypothetical protein